MKQKIVETQAPQGINTRFVWLDLLRGICAIAVAGYHFFPGNFALRFNWLFVDLFFILSGFVLYNKIPNQGAERSATKKFIIGRLLRFYPLLLIALTFKMGLILFSYIEGDNPQDRLILSFLELFPSLFFLQFIFAGVILVLVPLWSLTTEFWINVLTSLFHLHTSIRKVLLMIISGAGLIIASGLNNLELEDFSGYSIWVFLFGRTFCGFGLGLLLAMYFFEMKKDAKNVYVILSIFASFLACVFALRLTPTFVVLAADVFFATLILLLAGIPNPPVRSKFHVLGIFLGFISFGVYLLHPIFFIVGNRAIGSRLPNGISFVIQVLAMSLSVWLICKFIEPKLRNSLAKFLATST